MLLRVIIVLKFLGNSLQTQTKRKTQSQRARTRQMEGNPVEMLPVNYRVSTSPLYVWLLINAKSTLLSRKIGILIYSVDPKFKFHRVSISKKYPQVPVVI
jgi:hypothetical protein